MQFKMQHLFVFFQIFKIKVFFQETIFFAFDFYVYLKFYLFSFSILCCILIFSIKCFLFFHISILIKNLVQFSFAEPLFEVMFSFITNKSINYSFLCQFGIQVLLDNFVKKIDFSLKNRIVMNRKNHKTHQRHS